MLAASSVRRGVVPSSLHEGVLGETGDDAASYVCRQQGACLWLII